MHLLERTKLILIKDWTDDGVGGSAIHQWLGQLMRLWFCPEPQSALGHSFQRRWVSGTSPGHNVGREERP